MFLPEEGGESRRLRLSSRVLKIVIVAMFFAGFIYARREYDSRPRD